MGLRRERHGVVTRGSALAALLGAAVLFALAPPAALANIDEPVAWLGCWRAIAPDEDEGRTSLEPRVITCVSPGKTHGFMSFATTLEGAILSERELRLDGSRTDKSLGGCSGWERCVVSEKGARVYTTSEMSCAGGHTRKTNAVSMLTASDEWLEVSVVEVGSRAEISIDRYRAISHGTGRPPLDIFAAVESARIAAAAPLTSEDVIEALRTVNPIAVEALLFESGSRFWMDAEVLLRLSDAGVPAQVIDLMVALSFPDYFVVDEMTLTATRTEFRSPVLYPDWRYGYSAYYGYPYWYHHGWYYPYPPYHPPKVRVGRAVHGKGYTRVRSPKAPSGGISGLLSSPGGESAGGSKSSAGSVSAGPPGYSNGGSSSSASSDSSGGSSTGRWAKPRD